MKYVREHINEKFTQDSDPISDMGLGFNIEAATKLLKQVTDYFQKTWNIDIDWSETSGYSNIKYDKDIFGIDFSDVKYGEIHEAYLTISKKASIELFKSLYDGKHKKEIIRTLDLGWLLFYNNYEKIAYFQPYDLKNLYKTIFIVSFGDYIDENIREFTSQLEYHKKVKAFISES
jgi:hypothetical protein